ncbi:hypothetical protein FA13DRAFT_1640940, partial [Coprinellus micaceus]
HTDPLIHHGRHFGRAIYAFANIQALILSGLGADEDSPPETQHERRELRVFKKLLAMVPDLEERLMSSSEEDAMAIANMLQKGASSARSDDTKSLKGVILDWIGPLNPPLSRNVKQNRGFHHDRTGFLLCPPELDWNDPESGLSLHAPWNGLFRNELLVKASLLIFALSSAGVFSRTDCETDSETFYTSILELLEDPEEQDEVWPLMLWWNQRIFPSFSMTRRMAPTSSAWAKIKERRRTILADATSNPRNATIQ